jgi:tetratricopeptide (TPR) repeat protein
VIAAPRTDRARTEDGARIGSAPAVAVALLLAMLVLARTAPARANDFDQFQNARAAYDSQNYALAADLFRGLLVEAAPGDRRPLVLESRKYLAATALFLGRRQEAQAQFEALLRVEPDYVLDPLAFPDEVARLFTEVKARMEVERAHNEQERARAQAEAAAQRDDAAKQQRQRLDRLVALASTERIEERHSRWVAAMPFGIGQFQNGHDGLGLVLAVGEGSLLAISVVSFFLHENLRGQEPNTADLLQDARLAENVFRYTNQISLGLFAVIAAAGIVDAQVRFVPSRHIDRARALPADVEQLQLSVGPGGLRLTGSF